MIAGFMLWMSFALLGFIFCIMLVICVIFVCLSSNGGWMSSSGSGSICSSDWCGIELLVFCPIVMNLSLSAFAMSTGFV